MAVEEKKAMWLAEIVANKDANNIVGIKKTYCQLIKNEKGEFLWQEVTRDKKNIYQKLIHDADCLDIIRARDYFNPEYLDFYQNFAKQNPNALDEVALLRIEAGSVLALQGDERGRTDSKIKQQFEHADAYHAVVKTIGMKHFRMLPKLFSGNTLLPQAELSLPLLETTPFKEKQPLDESNLRAALREGKVFARSIPTPAGIRNKSTRPDETMAAVEVRKMLRRIGVPTRTLKKNRRKKYGNPHRSVSLIGWGGVVYSSIGFLIVNPNISEVTTVSQNDVDSGRGKKKNIAALISKSSVTPENIKQQLSALLVQQKMGTKLWRYHGRDLMSSHSEMTLRLTEAHAIYISKDHNLIDNKSHPHSMLLQALYLQAEYQRSTGILLPLFEYSGTHHFVNQLPAYQASDIKTLWVELCIHFFKKKLASAHESFQDFDLSSSIDQLKMQAMYQYVQKEHIKRLELPDHHYSAEWKAEINAAIVLEREKVIAEHLSTLADKIKQGTLSCFSPEAYYFLERFPALLHDIKEYANKEILQVIRSDNWKEQTDAIWKEVSIYDEDYDKVRDYREKIPRLCHLAASLSMREMDMVNAHIIQHMESEVEAILQKPISFRYSFHIGCGNYVVPRYDYEDITTLVKRMKSLKVDGFFDKKIKQIMNKLHDDFVMDCLQDVQGYKLASYHSLIFYLDKKLGLLDEHDKVKINQVMKVYGNHYKAGGFNDEGVWKHYLFLANYCDVSNEEKKHVLIGLLNARDQSERISFQKDFLKMIQENITLDFDVCDALLATGIDADIFVEAFDIAVKAEQEKSVLSDAQNVDDKNNPSALERNSLFATCNQQTEARCEDEKSNARTQKAASTI